MPWPANRLSVSITRSANGEVACRLADRLVVVEDREAGLHGVIEDLAAQLGDGQAEHVVVVDDQPLQEQIADLVDRERCGLRLVTALGHMRVQEAQRGLFIAVIGQHCFADAYADRQHDDVVALDEVLRQIAGTVHHDSDAHRRPLRLLRRL